MKKILIALSFLLATSAHADQAFKDFVPAQPAAAALGGTEVIPGVQSAATVKVTASQIKTFTSASPTLVTPALGTPASGLLTNATGLPLSTGVTGVLPVANGGSGTGSSLVGIMRGGNPMTAAEISGDCTTSGSNAISCTQTGGVSFAPIATSGSASDLSAGTVAATRMPALTGDTTSSAGTTATLTRQIHDNVTAITNASSPYTVVSTDSFVTCDATAGAVTINLPAATGTGREISFKKIDSTANACTPTRAGSDLIDGAASYSLISQYAASKVVDTASAVWNRSHTNQLAGDVTGVSTANIVGKVNGVVYPAAPSTNTIPVVTGSNTITYETAPVLAGGTGTTTSTGSGSVVLSSSPTLTTPALGTPSALVLTNATGLPDSALSANVPLINAGTNAFTGAISAVGSITTPRIIVNGSSIPANGVYLSAANTVGIASNTGLRIHFTSAGATTDTGGYISGGTKFTASGCSNSTTVGGQTAGSYNSGTSGTCTVTITLPTAPNGWVCFASDVTTAVDVSQPMTASTTTSCTISGTTVSGDTIKFAALGY